MENIIELKIRKKKKKMIQIIKKKLLIYLQIILILKNILVNQKLKNKKI